jgi:hypothetical protein
VESHHFDALVRAFGTRSTRRAVLGIISALGLADALGWVDDAEAKQRKRKKKKTCKSGTKKCGKTCIPESHCCSADDCGACESCLNGTCGAGCEAGQECQGGQCRCTTTSCVGCCDGDVCQGATEDHCGIFGEPCIACVFAHVCENGSCVCPGGWFETHGVCGPVPNCARDGNACTAHGQCCSGFCVGGSCTCSGTDQGCLFDAECCSGLHCVGSVCGACPSHLCA